MNNLVVFSEMSAKIVCNKKEYCFSLFYNADFAKCELEDILAKNPNMENDIMPCFVLVNDAVSH